MLDIKNDNGASIFWDCNFWSTFTNEDEKLYLGNRNILKFNNIHNIKEGEHYLDVIKVINILLNFFEGAVLAGIKPFGGDVSGFKELMVSESNNEFMSFPYFSECNIPHYISLLFHQFIKQRKSITICTWYLSMDFWGRNKVFDVDYYGYSKFKSLFLLKDEKTINFKLFLKLLFNLEQFVVFYGTAKGYKKSIKLDGAFSKEILGCCDMINNTLSSVFSSFTIVNPIDPISHYISNNSWEFKSKGWRLRRNKYQHPVFGLSDNCLIIEKM